MTVDTDSDPATPAGPPVPDAVLVDRVGNLAAALELRDRGDKGTFVIYSLWERGARGWDEHLAGGDLVAPRSRTELDAPLAMTGTSIASLADGTHVAVCAGRAAPQIRTIRVTAGGNVREVQPTQEGWFLLITRHVGDRVGFEAAVLDEHGIERERVSLDLQL